MTDLAFGTKCGVRGRKGWMGSMATAALAARACIRSIAPKASTPKPPVTAPRKSRREQFGRVNMAEKIISQSRRALARGREPLCQPPLRDEYSMPMRSLPSIVFALVALCARGAEPSAEERFRADV